MQPKFVDIMKNDLGGRDVKFPTEMEAVNNKCNKKINDQERNAYLVDLKQWIQSKQVLVVYC